MIKNSHKKKKEQLAACHFKAILHNVTCNNHLIMYLKGWIKEQVTWKDNLIKPWLVTSRHKVTNQNNTLSPIAQQQMDVFILLLT